MLNLYTLSILCTIAHLACSHLAHGLLSLELDYHHAELIRYQSSSPRIWDAVLFVHRGSGLHCFITVLSLTHAQWSGYYTGAVLRFRLTFPDDYPERIPTVQFVTDIFHPLIDQKGHFNLSSHLRPWKCVLVVIASLLMATFLHSDRKSIMSSTSYMISRLHSR